MPKGIYKRTQDQRQRLIQRNWKHGFACRGKKERLYGIWRRMIQRCDDPSVKEYDRYGGRGISVCAEWVSDYLTFRIWAHKNGYTDNLTIERKNNNGNYCPKNCKWVLAAAQARNTSQNHFIVFEGETKTLAEWSEIFDMESSLIRYRLKVGWAVEDALLLRPSNSHKGGSHEKYPFV